QVGLFWYSRLVVFRGLHKLTFHLSFQVIINSTLTEKMTFKKTSQKFGQWADSKTGAVHGLGFNSEVELVEFVDHFKQYVEASKGSPCTSASSNGRSGAEHNHSAGTDTTSLFPGQTTQLHSLVVDPPCTGGVPPGSLNSLNPTTLISGPVSLLPASTTQPTDTASGSAYQPLPPLQWQQQLKQAQAHIRRLEDELNATKRQAASAGLSQAVMSVQTLPVSEIGVAPSDRGVSHLPGRAMVSGLADGGIDDTIGLRDCLTRLDLSDPSIVNGAGEDWTRDTSSLNVKPTIPLLTQPGRSWCTGPETVRSLHLRLGHLLREAVELHARLGALLPQSTPGGPPE
ncbi:hypothetical protein AHF37_02274, partial [Paragonimus kellicotti]